MSLPCKSNIIQHQTKEVSLSCLRKDLGRSSITAIMTLKRPRTGCLRRSLNSDARQWVPGRHAKIQHAKDQGRPSLPLVHERQVQYYRVISWCTMFLSYCFPKFADYKTVFVQFLQILIASRVPRRRWPILHQPTPKGAQAHCEHQIRSPHGWIGG